MLSAFQKLGPRPVTSTQYVRKYDDKQKTGSDKAKITRDVLNANFTKEDIEIAIEHLKCNKSPGTDGIPAGILKACKDNLSRDIALILNYIVEKQNFLEKWPIGIRSALHIVWVKSLKQCWQLQRRINLTDCGKSLWHSSISTSVIFYRIDCWCI